MHLNIAHACVTENVNGPGRRFTVWVQGCPKDCPGCFNPGLRPFEPKREVAPQELAREAAAAGPLDGVSLSGGEPFAQAAGLGLFLDTLRAKAGREALPVIAFTGYTVEELRHGAAEWRELLDRLDLLVDGTYRKDEAADLPLRGSSNQRLVALTPAGEALKIAAEAEGPAGFAVIISAEGDVLFTGFPPEDLVQSTLQRLEAASGDADREGTAFCPLETET